VGVAVSSRVLQSVAECCSVLQCVAVCCTMVELQCLRKMRLWRHRCVLNCVAVAVFAQDACAVAQVCGAVWCSVV